MIAIAQLCDKCGGVKTPVQDKGKTRMRCSTCKNESVKKSRDKAATLQYDNTRGFADVDFACSKFLKSRGIYYNKFTDPARMVLPPKIEYLE